MKHLKAGLIGATCTAPFVITGYLLAAYGLTSESIYVAWAILAYFVGAVVDAARCSWLSDVPVGGDSK